MVIDLGRRLRVANEVGFHYLIEGIKDYASEKPGATTAGAEGNTVVFARAGSAAPLRGCLLPAVYRLLHTAYFVPASAFARTGVKVR